MKMWQPPSDETLAKLRADLDRVQAAIDLHAPPAVALISQLDQSISGLRSAGFSDISIGVLLAIQATKTLQWKSPHHMLAFLDALAKTQ